MFPREKEKDFYERIGPQIKLLPGVKELMAALKERGFKMAVGSSGPRENIELLLSTLSVIGYLQAIVAGREVKESKPSPQIFLRAAELIGVPPACCVVIEDAVAGVAAAKAGGM